jgi:hypothetical protein
MGAIRRQILKRVSKMPIGIAGIGASLAALALLAASADARPLLLAGDDTHAARPGAKKLNPGQERLEQPPARGHREARPDEDGSDQDDDAAPDNSDPPGCLFRKAPLNLLV